MAEILQDLKYLGKNSKVILDRQQRNWFGANVSAQAHFYKLGALSAQPNLSYSSHISMNYPVLNWKWLLRSRT